MNLSQLASIVQEHGTETMAWLNESVSVPAGQIPRRDVKLMLMALGKLEAVLASSAKLFATDPDFSTLDVLSPLSIAVFNKLKDDGVLTQSDLDQIATLGSKLIPRWQHLGFAQLPHTGDIEAAQRLI